MSDSKRDFRLERYRAVIFDMDGVLLDSEPIHHAAASRMLAELGHALDDETYRNHLGSTTAAFWRDLRRRYGLPEPVAHYEQIYQDRITETLLSEGVEPLPGVRELVAALRERSVRLAVASSSPRPWVDASLRAISLRDAFDVTVSGSDVRHGKPDPEIFLRAAELLHARPADCLVIEDAPNGVRAARAAGMDVVAVRTPYNTGHPFADATRLVDSLARLLPAAPEPRPAPAPDRSEPGA